MPIFLFPIHTSSVWHPKIVSGLYFNIDFEFLNGIVTVYTAIQPISYCKLKTFCRASSVPAYGCVGSCEFWLSIKRTN